MFYKWKRDKDCYTWNFKKMCITDDDNELCNYFLQWNEEKDTLHVKDDVEEDEE